MIILHITEKQIWEKEKENGKYGMSAIVANGHIPCFNVQDMPQINLQLSTLKDYVVLCIDTNKINVEIKNEPYCENGPIEPNIYEIFDTNAVVAIYPYTFDSTDHFVVTPELQNFELINNALELLNVDYISHKYFHDGTSSTIVLLNNEFIVKKDNPDILKSQVTFALKYKDVQKLQKIACYDKDYKFVVYNFIPGDVMHTVEDFEDLQLNAKEIVSNFENSDMEGFGYLHCIKNSWEEFLENEVQEANELFHEADYLLPTVEDAIKELASISFDKKLIHGDFGTHNFISQNGKFVAAIDPIPLLGDPAYDLLFALVSNIDLLPYLSINFLITYIDAPKSKVVALLKIVLFCRICRCAKYNKDWIETYLEFWDRIF